MRPFNEAELPVVEPITLDDAVSEGLMLAKYSSRMRLKNRIIVGVLTHERRYDPEQYLGEAKRALGVLIDEFDLEAARIARQLRIAASMPEKPRTRTTIASPTRTTCSFGKTPRMRSPQHCANGAQTRATCSSSSRARGRTRGTTLQEQSKTGSTARTSSSTRVTSEARASGCACLQQTCWHYKAHPATPRRRPKQITSISRQHRGSAAPNILAALSVSGTGA